ncbi:fluoride efflux transporter CrcB [Candidatus Nitrosotalea bavarica]|uniref:fluoride efflux transporter CrcB n=1 Tax=Candidatus Nitrosotalea bavarica TaxID=1903277 RepID=UPI000C6FD858|nr:fluoride efflux transporter CrcB [Candidatus Nitrosotalea bavarica]
MKPIVIIFIAVGGLVGTFLRYRITESPLLLGTLSVNVLIVNIIGSFILGLFAVMSQQWSLDQKYAMLIAIGFCGSLTTMSSFALETSNLFDNKQLGLVAVNIIANVGLSIGAIFGGKSLMTVILQGGFR